MTRNSNPFGYIALNLTNRCNTFCRYCFQNARANDQDYLDFNFVKTVLEYAQERNPGRRILHLTGGEPTLNRDFFKILEYAVSHGFIIRIQSNGMRWTQFSHEQMQMLSDPNVSIKISLDGWNSDTHEYLRAKGSFGPVMEGIARIHEYCRMVGLKTCVHSRNVGNLEEMVYLADRLGLQGFSYNLIRNEGAALSNVPAEDMDIPEVCVAKRLIPVFNDEKYQYLMNGNNLLLFYYTSGNIVYQKHFYIDYDGSVYPHQSCLKKEYMGNVLQDGLQVLDPARAIRDGHEHVVDKETVDYVKSHFVPIKRK